MIILVMVVMLFLLEMVLGLTGQGGGGRGDLRLLIILLFGWKGGVLTNVFFLNIVVCIVMGVIKRCKEDRKVLAYWAAEGRK